MPFPSLPGLAGGVCVWAYAGTIRHVLLAAKSGDHAGLWPPIAEQLAVAVETAGLRPTRDWCVVPVPSHPWSHLRRGFSPGPTLARRVGRLLDLRVEARLRRRWSSPVAQKRRARPERLANLEPFGVPSPLKRAQPVLLVDDVLTTGATLQAATRALQAAGAGPVYGVVWARRM